MHQGQESAGHSTSPFRERRRKGGPRGVSNVSQAPARRQHVVPQRVSAPVQRCPACNAAGGAVGHQPDDRLRFAVVATARHVGGEMSERRVAERTLVNAARGLTLLAVEAYSVGLAAGLAVMQPLRMAAFVGDNTLAAEPRALLLRVALCCAAIAVLYGCLLWRRRGADRLWDTARRLAPALLAAAVPPLFNWRIWGGRDLHFLALAGAVVLGLRGLVLVAQSSPPCGASRPPWLRLPSGDWGGARTALRRPLVLVCLGAVAYTLYFAYHTIVHHRIGLSTSFDLGIEDNLLWNIVHGGPFFKSSPFSGTGASLFAYHAPWLAYALAPIYALHQSPETLLAIQAALVGAAAVPLFLWARAHLGDAPAALVSFCYLLSPAVHGPNLYDFHYPVLAPFFLWLTLWAVESRHRGIAGGAFVLCLATREDVAASVAVLGLYFLLSGRRVKAGAAISTVATAYFAITKFVAMPMARDLSLWVGGPVARRRALLLRGDRDDRGQPRLCAGHAPRC